MRTREVEQDEVRSKVREQYGKVARETTGCGCAPTCCGNGSSAPGPVAHAETLSRGLGYSMEQIGEVPVGANLGLGCGNPQAIAALRPGETVLDLGSGAGFDSFLAARVVGTEGRVIGVDMTPEMVSKARQHQTAGGYRQVEFRLGEIESLPVADGSVDAIISNCVINLSPDKPRVFREAFRVLKTGGRLAISDVIAFAKIPDPLRKDWELYTGCVAGASTVVELQSWLEEAGFAQVRIEPKEGSQRMIQAWFPDRNLEHFIGSATIQAIKPDRQP